MRENEEPLVVGVGGVRLQLDLIFLKQFPVFAVLERRLHENAVLVRGEVLAAHDLTDKVHFRLKVCLGAHLGVHGLQLVDLLLLQVLQRLGLLLLFQVLASALQGRVLVVATWHVRVGVLPIGVLLAATTGRVAVLIHCFAALEF